jgi:hypothetical protein
MLTFDRSVVLGEPPKPQTWLLLGLSSLPTEDDGAPLQDLPAIELGLHSIDIAGQKFGRLTALRPVGRQKQKHYGSTIIWLCHCDCGRFYTIITSRLKQGQVQSCGCLMREKVSQRQFKNRQAQRFGKLTVLKPVGKSKCGHILWQCVCDCGRITTVKSANLTTGNVKSCGCLRKRTGPKSPNWNPNRTTENRIHSHFGIAQVRSQVFLRDGYLCMLCGKHDKALNAHHLEPWSKNPALRFDPDNMVTLCNSCHMTYHRDFPAKTANSANFVSWFRQRKAKPPHHSPLAWSSPESVGVFPKTSGTTT